MTRGQASLFPADRKRTGRIRRGFDTTLKALRDTGRLEPIDEAMTALCRVLADELDAACRDDGESRFTRAAIAGRYQTALEAFMAGTVGDDGDDGLDDMLAQLLDGEDPRPADA